MSRGRRTVLISLVAFLGLVMVASGCQTKPNRSGRTRIGRTGRGPVGSGPNSSYLSGNASTQIGYITGNDDQSFQNALWYFTAPTLANYPDEQLGYVSSQPNGTSRVEFWGEASMYGGANASEGVLDGQRARLHIEIFDDRVGQPRSDGSPRTQVSVHIGYDQDGFVSAQGSVQGGQVNLIFNDNYGAIRLSGAISGSNFNGTIYFSNQWTGGEMPLGQFQVAACGFFVCGI